MANLVVIEFDDMYKAEEMRLKLQKLQQEYLIDLEDAVVAVKDENGKVKLNQIHNLTAGNFSLTAGSWAKPAQLKPWRLDGLSLPVAGRGRCHRVDP